MAGRSPAQRRRRAPAPRALAAGRAGRNPEPVRRRPGATPPTRRRRPHAGTTAISHGRRVEHGVRARHGEHERRCRFAARGRSHSNEHFYRSPRLTKRRDLPAQPRRAGIGRPWRRLPKHRARKRHQHVDGDARVTRRAGLGRRPQSAPPLTGRRNQAAPTTVRFTSTLTRPGRLSLTPPAAARLPPTARCRWRAAGRGLRGWRRSRSARGEVQRAAFDEATTTPCCTPASSPAPKKRRSAHGPT